MIVIGAVLYGWRSSEPSSQNYLAGKYPSDFFDIFSPERLTDGVVDFEGAPWDSRSASGFGPYRAFAEFDFGELCEVRGLVVQANAAGGLSVELSTDGSRWERVWNQEPALGAHGLKLVERALFPVRARYSRIAPYGGGHRFGISEFQLLSHDPSGRPPLWNRKRIGVPPSWGEVVTQQARQKILVGALAVIAAVATLARGSIASIAVATASALSLIGLSLFWTFGPRVAGCLFLMCMCGFGAVAAHRAIRSLHIWRGMIFGCLTTAGALAWTNFGVFHGAWEVHYHDAFHYFMGAKYSSELGFTRLYDCSYVAERESGRWPQQVNPTLRNLPNRGIKTGADALGKTQECHSRFSADRWKEFSSDVNLFIAHLGHANWVRALHDFGYNATPAWTWVYKPLLDRTAATKRSLVLLSLIDPILYAIGFWALAYAFGVECLALAVLVFGLGFPWFYLWTSGAIGRATWIAAFMIGLSLLHRRKFVAGGTAIGLSSALQLLPVFSLLGPLLVCALGWLRNRTVPRPAGRTICAAVGSTLAIAIAGMLLTGSSVASAGFLGNTRAHVSTAFRNQMGLGQIVDYVAEPDGLAMASLFVPYGFDLRTEVLVVAALGFILLWGICVRLLEETWQQIAFGLFLIVPLLEISCYYYIFLLFMAPLALGQVWRWLFLLVPVIVTQVPALNTRSLPTADYYSFATICALATFILLSVDILRKSSALRLFSLRGDCTVL